jgi:hypothetical protein
MRLVGGEEERGKREGKSRIVGRITRWTTDEMNRYTAEIHRTAPKRKKTGRKIPAFNR